MKKISKEKISSLLSSDKARISFVIIGIVSILLIFLSGQFTGEKNTDNNQKDFSSANYCETLTEELTNMIENLEGVGEAQVLITLENSYEYFYFDDKIHELLFGSNEYIFD